MMNIYTVLFLVMLLNLPFGFWRAGSRKFSHPWFLAIHLPVPAVIALRIFSGIGWQLQTLPLMLAAFSTGQLLGGKLRDTFIA